MNSENSKTSDPHRLLLILTDKMRRKDMLLYRTTVFTMHGKIQKSHTEIINLKYQLQHEMKNLNYLMDHILHQIFKIILNVFKKNMRQLLTILQ